MPGDVLAAANPDVSVGENVLDEADQRLGPARVAGQARVHADRHHPRPFGALLVKEVEAVAQKGEEVLSGGENAAAELRIVGGQRIGYDEVRPIADPYPIGQLVVVGVAVVEKPAVLDQEPAGVFRRRITTIPAGGALAGGLADQVDGGGNLLPLLAFGKPGMVGPAIAVAADIPVAGSDCSGRRRVRLEGPSAAKNRHRQPEAREDPMEAPEPDPGAVFEHALGTEVAPADPEVAAEHLGQPALGHSVAGRIGEFRTFLEIDHEIDGDAGVAGPSGMGRLSAVTDEVAGHGSLLQVYGTAAYSPSGPDRRGRIDQSASLASPFSAAAIRLLRRVISASGTHSSSMNAPKMTKLSLAPQRSAIPP